MDVTTAQYLCLAGLFLGVLLSLLLPALLLSGRISGCGEGLHRCQSGIHLSNCFSGGVFLATFFVGLLPEVRRDVDSLLLASSVLEVNVPVTECIVLLGFFLALFLERLAMAVKTERSHSHGHSHSPTASVVDIDAHQSIVRVDETSVAAARKHHGHSHDIGALVGANSLVRFGMLLLSLSIHSIFEGMALGLQEEMHSLVNLFVGIWIHECLIAFALGVSVTRMKLSTLRVLGFAVVFASLLPFGQVVGIMVGSGRSGTVQAVSAALQAIAAGTFVHVTFFEIIPECLAEGPVLKRLLRVVFLFVGFVLISIVTWASYAL